MHLSSGALHGTSVGKQRNLEGVTPMLRRLLPAFRVRGSAATLSLQETAWKGQTMSNLFKCRSILIIKLDRLMGPHFFGKRHVFELV